MAGKSQSLLKNGHSVLTPRDGMKGSEEMSVEEMEQRLSKYSRRPPDRINPGGPQTARALLEENQKLSKEKAKAQTLERQNSRELIEQLFERDQAIVQKDKERAKGRRTAHQALAMDYKAAIVQKESDKQKEYSLKVNSGRDKEYFPFVEGETVDKLREEQNSKLKGELQGFLNEQKQANPPRHDPLLASVDVNYRHMYSLDGTASAVPSAAIGEEVAPHIGGCHPRFLTRAREHMSRRIHDDHVRKALQDKVETTKEELVETARKRRMEVQQIKDGLMVNDALRYDNAMLKAQERKKNAQFVKAQMEERKTKQKNEVKDDKKECAGYWGPEEKELQGGEMYSAHCQDLIKQMEVNQHRRLDSRHRRLQQERRLVDNSLSEMRQDRQKDAWKSELHREVLTTTWGNQVKIREAVSHVADIGK